MQLKHMLQNHLGCLLSRGELRQGNEMSHLGETINDCEYGGITFRERQSSHKIQGDVRPGAMWHRERAQETRRRSPGGLVAGTDRTGINIF